MKTKPIKTKGLFTILAFATCFLSIEAQDLIISRNGELNKFTTAKNNLQKLSSAKSSDFKFDSNTSYYVDQTAFKSNQIDDVLNVSSDYDFYKGLQSPYDSNVWIYLQKQKIGGNFSLVLYNKLTGSKTILQEVNDNKDWSIMAHKPIAWSKDKSIIYMEGIYLNGASEHEGIWEFSLINKQFKKLVGLSNYMTTPAISPDRSKFYTTGNIDKTNDKLHGEHNQIIEFDLNTLISKTLLSSKGDNLVINGFEGNMQTNNFKATSFSNLDYFLPWDTGKNRRHVVVRHGTPGPVGNHTNDGRCNCVSTSAAHDYAGIDFAPDVQNDDNVRASQAGVIDFAGISGSLTTGYGRLVIIRHSDGTRTYYGHNRSILVSEGATVSKGQILSKEGTTGGSTGVHIHFEWRSGGEILKGSFTGIGEPRADFFYISNNQVGPVSNTTPVITAPANGATLPSNSSIGFLWTSTVVGTPAYRIQISKVNTGWTALNGFTTSATAAGNIVVNQSSGSLNY